MEKRPRMKICKGCYAYVTPSRMLCPYCGYEFKPEDDDKEKQIEETKEQLERRSTATDDMRRAFFEGQVQLARSKGWKPGAASAKFKQHYGVWPPWDWSNEVKSSFASDPDWQAALEKNQIEREKREAEKALKNADEDERAAIQEESGGEKEPPIESDSPFDDWLGDEGIK